MRSLRRGMSMTQQQQQRGDGAAGAAQDGDVNLEQPSPPKSPLGRPYFAPGRLIGSVDFYNVGGLLKRSSRPSSDRSRSKGPQLRRALFHFSVCFMLGVFISFATFVTVDVSSKHKAFSFEEDGIGSARKEMFVVSRGNHSLDAVVAKWEVKKDVIDGLSTLMVSHAEAPSLDSEPPPAAAGRKLLIVVTPTYVRPFQAYYLNRLAHTLRVVRPPLLWIVVEMSSQSAETAKLLRETGVMYRHLFCNQNLTGVRNREVHQRNVALSHIEKHQLDGIVHFADDDRVYSVELFDQMQQIRRFGIWPVAVLTESRNKVSLEGPVCNGSQVIGWHTNQRSKLSRRFHVDMSGFAFNSTILWDRKRWKHPTLELIRQNDAVKEGFQETTFIEHLVEDENQMEGLANDCSRIMVWHLHVEGPELPYTKGWLIQKNLEVVAPLT
ncbi:putative beta-1,4-xylosyltransferase IRX9H [Iris pallida]|uniref:Glycosyltransferases n=1 Tax=Iris pallida TaxID=29817 RepID=A0AAX6GQW9_IRIPA|nr:putative beta-1,4-xylosyltransferase IRX9H [Iris pallida]